MDLLFVFGVFMAGFTVGGILGIWIGSWLWKEEKETKH